MNISYATEKLINRYSSYYVYILFDISQTYTNETSTQTQNVFHE